MRNDKYCDSCRGIYVISSGTRASNERIHFGARQYYWVHATFSSNYIWTCDNSMHFCFLIIIIIIIIGMCI